MQTLSIVKHCYVKNDVRLGNLARRIGLLQIHPFGFEGSVAKFLNDRAGSVILNLFMKLTNKIAAPDVIGHRHSIDLCGSCA